MSQAAATTVYRRCVQRLRAGDAGARDELLRLACDRLERLTRKMLQDFPAVRRWEQTDDVLQRASLRLWKSLESVQLDSPRHFFHLAAMQIRRELIDLARHYMGQYGVGANQASVHSVDTAAREGSGSTHDPSHLARWTELHAKVEELPDDLREVFQLLWYQELTQAEASELIGVSDRTIKRRWQAARMALFDALNGELPG